MKLYYALFSLFSYYLAVFPRILAANGVQNNLKLVENLDVVGEPMIKNKPPTD